MTRVEWWPHKAIPQSCTHHYKGVGNYIHDKHCAKDNTQIVCHVCLLQSFIVITMTKVSPIQGHTQLFLAPVWCDRQVIGNRKWLWNWLEERSCECDSSPTAAWLQQLLWVEVCMGIPIWISNCLLSNMCHPRLHSAKTKGPSMLPVVTLWVHLHITSTILKK